MQLSAAARPISAVKARLEEIIRTFSEEAAPPVVIMTLPPKSMPLKSSCS
ncbi:hypothetical protein DWUX_2616 [Desulfovibrio diazotrophicus]|nr:hypothetical protein DWUX_2616 [Desulfovibrio diazotrophicus]